MPTSCRAFSTVEEARSAVDRLLAAGQPGEEIRVLSGDTAGLTGQEAVQALEASA